MTFGHNFVVLALWVPLPWNPARGVSLPLLFRLYRSPKTCPARVYKSRPDLAAELIETLADWLEHYEVDRRVVVLGDSEYACSNVIRSLPANFEFLGAIRMSSAFYALPSPERGTGRGRPPLKGPRLPTPKDLLDDPSVPWKAVRVQMYGREVEILVKTFVALWYGVCKTDPVRVVLTRDPKGYFKDRAYITTWTKLPAPAFLAEYARQWTLEATFRDTKQFLRLEDPQNGFSRRKSGARRKPKRPGPQARGRKGQPAVERTVPTIFCAYALAYLWYFENGDPERDVARSRFLRPWYTTKKEPSFEDILLTLRCALAKAGFSLEPLVMQFSQKSQAATTQAALAA